MAALKNNIVVNKAEKDEQAGDGDVYKRQVQDKLEVFKHDGGGIEENAVFFQEFRAEPFVAGGFHVQAGQQVAQDSPRFPRGDVLVPAWNCLLYTSRCV